MRPMLVFLATVWLALAAPAMAAVVKTGHAETELTPVRSEIAPGETVTFVLRQKPQAGWHTYWINPGDSGQSPGLDWTLPPGFIAGPLIHPAPGIERLGPITTYVHEPETLYPLAVKAPDSLKPGDSAALSVKATWLICDEICVPESGVFSFDLPVTQGGKDDPRGANLLAKAVAGLPAPVNAAFSLDVGETVRLSFPADVAGETPLSRAMRAGLVRAPQYFPYSASLIDHAAGQNPKVSAEAITFDIPKSLSFVAAEARGEGLLSVEVKEGERWVRRAFMFGRPPGDGPVPSAVEAMWGGAPAPVVADLPESGAGAIGDLLKYVFFAFIGGLILNVMPCVLPVLSMKAFSLANAAQHGQARRHGHLFLAGVMLTFLALGGALLALKAAGAAAGWGFQLQEPLVVAALALLFFAIGLNLMGAFEVGGVENVGAGLAGMRGDAGAFFTGALAVVAATPCTAPFMASAMGWAATQPPTASMSVFLGLGLGFAAPFTALSFAPGLRKLLPKPGPWMEKVKQLLAFPMFGTVVWLVYVFAAQKGPEGAAALLAALVACAFLVWTLKGGVAWRVSGVLVAAITLIAAWPMVQVREARASDAGTSLSASDWSPARVSELTDAGKPVFVNFTAAWCVTCKANEISALSRPAVRQAFEEQGVVVLKGDWTARDGAIAAELARHGRDGVPLYLYYSPGAKTPQVLPQVLSERLLIEAVRPPV